MDFSYSERVLFSGCWNSELVVAGIEEAFLNEFVECLGHGQVWDFEVV